MQKLIIASNIGGSNETVIDGKTGILFKAANSDDLSKKIIKVMNMDPNELIKMGINGRENAVKKFNVEKMCFSTYSEYKKLFN
jgi:glycosyltransferase involved in cell wall biosynthesis